MPRPSPLSVLVLLTATPFAAAQIRVPQDHPTVQAAIQVAPAGSTVLVAPGTYYGPIDFLGKTLTVVSEQGPELTVLDAVGAGTGVTFANGESAATRLEGFTVRGGVGSAGRGGGLHIFGASPTIVACDIVDNDGGSGLFAGSGGVHVTGPSTPVLEDCRIADNDGGNGVFVSGGGGGLGSTQGTTVTLRRCSFDDNRGGNGPDFGGAGAIRAGGTVILDSCTLRANLGGSGSLGGPGGVQLVASFAPTSTFVNCVFLDNQGGAPSGAGALLGFLGTTAMVSSCTLTGNVGAAPAGVGGIDAVAAQQVTVVNSILWNDVSGPLASGPELAGNAFATASLVGGGFPGVGNLDADPRLTDVAAGDIRLLGDSPCLDVGSAATPTLPARDFEDDPRNVGGVDIGADEFCLSGSGEDVRLLSDLNGAGDPADCFKDMTLGDVLNLTLESPRGTVPVALFFLGAQVFTDGQPPAPTSGFPELHLNDGPGSALLFLGILMPAGGFNMTFGVTMDPSGLALRVQALALHGQARNGIFATSNAHHFAAATP